MSELIDLGDLTESFSVFKTAHNNRAKDVKKLQITDATEALNKLKSEQYLKELGHQGRVPLRYNIARHLTDMMINARAKEVKLKEGRKAETFYNRLMFINALLLNHTMESDEANKFKDRFKKINKQIKKIKELTSDKRSELNDELGKLSKEIINKSGDKELKNYGTTKTELKSVIEDKMDRLKTNIKTQKTIEDRAKKTLEKDMENLRGETDIIFEQLDEAENKNKKLIAEKRTVKTSENKDIGETLDDILDDTKKNRVQLEKEEEEKEEEETAIVKAGQRETAIVKAGQREKNIERLEKLKNQEIRRHIMVGSGGLGLGGAIASLPYIPKIIQSIRGVHMKKKRTKDDIILLNKTGVDNKKIEENKRIIEDLNRRLDNQELGNRQRDINKITMIGQQNRFNRVAINNIRGRNIHVKNRIKMHNITRRKFFNI